MGVVVKYRSMGDMLSNDSGDTMIDHDHRHARVSKYRPRAALGSWQDNSSHWQEQPIVGKRLSGEHDERRRMVPLLANSPEWRSCQLLDEASDPDNNNKQRKQPDINRWPGDCRGASKSQHFSQHREQPKMMEPAAHDGLKESAKLWVSSSAIERRRRRLPMRKLQHARAKLQQRQQRAAAKPADCSNGRETMTLAGKELSLDANDELASDSATLGHCRDARLLTGDAVGQRQLEAGSPELDRDGPGLGQLLGVVGIQGQAGAVGSPSDKQQQPQAAPADRCNGAQAAANKNIPSRTGDRQASSLELKAKSEQEQENNRRQQQQETDSGQLAKPCSSPASKPKETGPNLSNSKAASSSDTKTNIATKLRPMGSCRDSVIQLANQARKSGCYKVAQQQQQQLAHGAGQLQSPEAGHDSLMTLMVGEQRQAAQQQPEMSGYSCLAARQERRLATRHSRTGRSPISLQRLTNNRLAKHRLKIQQQRQEQLARIAVHRGPEAQSAGEQIHVTTSSSRGLFTADCPRPASNRSHQPETYIQIEEVLPEERASGRQQEQQLRSGARELLGGLFGKIASRLRARGQASHNSQQQQQASGGRAATSLTAGFSGLIGFVGQESQGTRSQERRFTCATRDTGDALVYSPINMLRSSELASSSSSSSSSSSASSFMARDVAGAGANNGRHRSRDNHHNNQSSPQAREQNDYFCANFDSQTIDSSISSASSTLSLNKPFCKVCHMGNLKDGDKLISPCKCSGTMQYIHCGCLLKWLEISNRGNEKPMCCELCAHEYIWHKRFNFKNIQLPRCSFKDLILHLMFLLAIATMLFSAIAPMIRRPSQQDLELPAAGHQLSPMASQSTSHQQSYTYSQGSRTKHHSSGSSSGHLATDEKFMLICAASFFMSFFLAIYVQTKARDTLYGLLVKFMNMNRTYYITEYDHNQLQQQQQQQASQSTNQQQGPCADGATSNNLKCSSHRNQRETYRGFGSRFADIKGLVMMK